MAKHEFSTPMGDPSQPFVNEPSMSFYEWRSARMEEEFGTDDLGMEHYPQGRGVVQSSWTSTPVMIPSAMAFDRALTDKEKVLCITILSASNATSYGGDAYRSLADEDYLCEQLGMSHDELDVAVQKLHDMGYVNIVGKDETPHFNRRNVNEYLLEEVGYKYNHEQYLKERAKWDKSAEEKAEQSPKRASRSISSSMRLRVYKHDGYQCVVCKSNEDLAIDHIIPIAHGGTNARENLQTLCQPCNSSKGTKSMDEWMGGRE